MVCDFIQSYEIISLRQRKRRLLCNKAGLLSNKAGLLCDKGGLRAGEGEVAEVGVGRIGLQAVGDVVAAGVLVVALAHRVGDVLECVACVYVAHQALLLVAVRTGQLHGLTAGEPLGL